MRHKLALSLVMVFSFAGALVNGADTVSDAETKFYRSISLGDADAAYQQMHPALQELIDLPVLEAWSIAVRDTLGSYQSKTQSEFKRTQQLTGVMIDIESELVFEHGSATASMSFFDGQMVAFNVQSDQLTNWFEGPTRLDPYTKTAEAFIAAFLRKDGDQARSLMHDALKKLFVENELESMMQNVAENSGALKESQLKSHRMSLENDRQALYLVYGIDCENATGECEIEIQFIGMKGHLIGFNFQ